MPLLFSQLFRGDADLEAAATRDPAHITPGARGKHVEKIQTALNLLDNAGLTVDGAYGTATANAVLSYKTKRKIINYSYQTTADKIVGKMTIAKLDEEMRAYESRPPARIELIPISPRANTIKAYPRINFKITESNALVAAPTAPILPTQLIAIDVGSTAEIEVRNGSGYELTMTSSNYIKENNAVFFVPGSNDPVTYCGINTSDALRFKIKGLKWGSAILWAQNHKAGPAFTEKMVIEIRDLRPTRFHPTRAHHHEPVQEPDDWNRVCAEAAKDPDSGNTLKALAKVNANPRAVAEPARLALAFTPMARWHFDYYLRGDGGVVNEDGNLERWIKGDAAARLVIAQQISLQRTVGQMIVTDYFEFRQKDFGDSDARNSFGTIDRLDYSADFNRGIVDLWFEDTYEWHPPYPQYVNPMRCPNPVKRESNFAHAALVQMKTRGAKDFQMRGKASFPMNLFPGL